MLDGMSALIISTGEMAELSTSELLTDFKYLLIGLGFFLIFVGFIISLARANELEGSGYVLLIFLFPIIGIPVLAYRHWQKARTAFKLWLFGFILLVSVPVLHLAQGVAEGIAYDLETEEMAAAYLEDSENPNLAQNLGLRYLRLGRHEEALPLLLYAIQNEHKLRDFCGDQLVCDAYASKRRLTEVYNKLGRHQEALNAWNRYVMRSNNHSLSDAEEYAIALYGVGRKNEARRIFWDLCDSGHGYLCQKHAEKLVD